MPARLPGLGPGRCYNAFMLSVPWFRLGTLGRSAARAPLVSALALLAFTAQIDADEVLYRSADLRIVRSLDKDGHPIVLVTNLDEGGARLAGGAAAEACPPSTSPSEPVAPTGPAEAAPPPEVRVSVNPPAGTPSVQSAGAAEVQIDS